jgi:hypothetical protein
MSLGSAEQARPAITNLFNVDRERAEKADCEARRAHVEAIQYARTPQEVVEACINDLDALGAHKEKERLAAALQKQTRQKALDPSWRR